MEELDNRFFNHGNMKEVNISSEMREDFDTAIAQLTFPIIVKPVDLTGGKGIHRAANIEEARAAYKDACSRTRQDHIVVEEFVQGTNHGFSAMLVKGKVAFAFADNEQYYINKYMVSGANAPGTSGSETLAKLRDYSERIARELNLVDGILHIQYIERPDGTPVIIEICRRPPGARPSAFTVSDSRSIEQFVKSSSTAGAIPRSLHGP